MRIVVAALVAALVPLAAPAQTAPAAAPATSPAATPCEPRQATITGGIGRATVVAFTGAIFRERVCAVVANVSFDAFSARIAPGVPTVAEGSDATLIAAGVGDAGGVTLALGDLTLSGIGPYVVEPGGRFPATAADTSEQPRVVLAFAGGRVVLIGTSPVTLTDLTRVLRDQPDLFGADAVERAVVLASGADAALEIGTDDGTFGIAPLGTRRVLRITKRV